MPQSLHEYFANEPVLQLRQEVLEQLDATEKSQLYNLLDATVIKSLSKIVTPAARPQAVQLLRAETARFVAWVNQQYPTARLSITEALTRVLLSLTVETKYDSR